MGYALRHINPEFGDLVEVTTRTVQGRRLLRPSAELNEIILGVLGRGLTMEVQVGVCAFTFVSNHYDMLLRAPVARDLSRFMNYVNGNLGREVCRLVGWEDKVWAKRYSGIQVADEDSVEQRLRYVLAHGAKEGLVASPLDWPGVTCLPGLLDGETLSGVWFDRTREYRARQQGKSFDRYEFATRYEVPLVPLPGWEGLSASERQARCAQIVEEIEHETRENNRSRGQVPPGPHWVVSQDPHQRGSKLPRRAAPLCHASTAHTRQRYSKAHRAVVAAFRRAALKLAVSDAESVGFPAGTFPPGLPFVPWPEAKAPCTHEIEYQSMPP